jgi:GWxTD domain-containing protein
MNPNRMQIQHHPVRSSRCGMALGVFTLLLLMPVSELLAQRITYEYLRVRDRQPAVFFEHVVVPDTSESGMKLVTAFRLENSFLSFRRHREGQAGNQERSFFADPTVQVSIQRRPEAPGRDTAPRPPVTRTWSETVYASTYEQTRSSTSFLQNILSTSLEPGTYRIESTARANSRSRRGLTPSLRIPDMDDADTAFIYFLDQQSPIEPPFTTPLMNMGNNVYFGRDHQLLIWFPSMEEGADYALEINKVRISRQDTTVQDKVMEYSLDSGKLFSGYIHDVVMEGERPILALNPASGGATETGTFYLLTVPNSTFENAHYRVRIQKKSEDGEPKTIARRTYQSFWLDMPVSLLNLDVAVNMMRFIMDDDQHRELRRGNRQQREERFRQFWAERDPTPDREYNELMVEYFRRVDYAFDNFTTPQAPGYESDQGKVYIRHGEPDRRERTFPPNQPAREIWFYGDRSFVFEATTGFGDFRLIDRR